MLATAGVARDLGAVSLGVRVGAVIDGHVDAEGGRYDIAPGIVAALAVDWRVFAAPTDPLTLTLGLQLGVAHTTLTLDGATHPWTATDARASITASRTLWEVLTPYLSARVFGGPIAWRGATGSDTTHVQLALGLAYEPVRGWSIHLEGAALAERGLFGGLALAF